MLKSKIPGGNELLNPEYILKDKLKLFYGSRVADLGCGGSGYFSFQAAQMAGDSGLVYAVDVLKMVLKNIDHRAKMLGLKNIKTVWSNLETVGGAKINDATVDFVMLVSVLFQNEHPERVFREGARLLKSKGKLLVVDWKQGIFPFGPPAEKKIDPDKVYDFALGAGLKKKDQFDAGRFHYGIVFERI